MRTESKAVEMANENAKWMQQIIEAHRLVESVLLTDTVSPTARGYLEQALVCMKRELVGLIDEAGPQH